MYYKNVLIATLFVIIVYILRLYYIKYSKTENIEQNGGGSRRYRNRDRLIRDRPRLRNYNRWEGRPKRWWRYWYGDTNIGNNWYPYWYGYNYIWNDSNRSSYCADYSANSCVNAYDYQSCFNNVYNNCL